MRPLQELKDGDGGELRIGATYYFTTRILPPVLGKYMRRYPQVKLTLLEGHSNKNLALLREQSLDLAFACPGPDKDDFIHYPAFQDCIILAVPALYDINKTVGIAPLNGLDVIQGRHLEESCPTVDLSKFSDVPWILLTEELDMYKRTEQFFNRAGYQPKVCLRVEQFITAYHLARAGIGATFLYDRCIQDASRDMCYYKVPYPESVRHLDMVLNRNRYVSRAARLFVSMLQEHYGSENC